MTMDALQWIVIAGLLVERVASAFPGRLRHRRILRDREAGPRPGPGRRPGIAGPVTWLTWDGRNWVSPGEGLEE